ncbi:hypothetical protein F5880DRAFT_1656424 [Lentinula raphanica]|nr:hypothetical protein F5880DRAFT_1656424 [Lentinula raphanica]
MGFLIIGVNIFFVRVYGELGFSFSMLNIMLIIELIITGLCIDLGGVSGQLLPGFQYWRNPGPFVQYLDIEIEGSLGQFLGLWTTLSNATYAYANIESIAATAAKTESPRRNILKAEKLHSFSMILAPLVIAANLAGIKVVPHIINAVVLASARKLFDAGWLQPPGRFMGKSCPKVPPLNQFIMLSLTVSVAFGYMTLESSALTVFGWFQDLVSAAALVTWMIICLLQTTGYPVNFFGLHLSNHTRRGWVC